MMFDLLDKINKNFLLEDLNQKFRINLFDKIDLNNLSNIISFEDSLLIFLNLNNFIISDKKKITNKIHNNKLNFTWLSPQEFNIKSENYTKLIKENKELFFFIHGNEMTEFQFLGKGNFNFFKKIYKDDTNEFLYEFNSILEVAPNLSNFKESLKTNTIEEEEKKKRKILDIANFLQKDVNEFQVELSIRTLNCLNSNNLKNFYQVIKKNSDELLRLKNFGKKCLYEIYNLIEPFGLSLGTDLNSKNLDADLLEIQNKLLTENQKNILQKQNKKHDEKLLCHLSLDIEYLNPKVRASNFFKENSISYIYQLLKFSESELLCMPNLGRRSLKEMTVELKKINSDLQLGFEFLPKDMELIESYKDNVKLKSKYAPNTVTIKKTNLINEIKHFLDYALENKKQKKIIFARFGLTNGNALTLEEIAQTAENFDFKSKVTRERIRQIEAKGLKLMKKKIILNSHKNLLPSLKDVKDFINANEIITSKDFAKTIGFDSNTKLSGIFLFNFNVFLKVFNFNFQTFIYRLNRKSKRLIFLESQRNLKQIISLITEEVIYGNIGDVQRIIKQNRSNLKETQIIEYIKLCELEFFPNQQRFFWLKSEKNRILKILYRIFSLNISLGYNETILAINKVRTHTEIRNLKYLDKNILEHIVNSSKNLLWKGDEIKARDYKKLNFLANFDLKVLNFIFHLKSKTFSIKQLKSYMRLNEIPLSHTNYWTHYSPFVRPVNTYKVGGESYHEFIFSYDKIKKNDLRNFIENEYDEEIVFNDQVSQSDIFSGTILSEEDNDFAEFEGNYKLQNNCDIKIEIKKNIIRNLEKVFKTLNLKPNQSLIIEKVSEDTLKIYQEN